MTTRLQCWSPSEHLHSGPLGLTCDVAVNDRVWSLPLEPPVAEARLRLCETPIVDLFAAAALAAASPSAASMSSQRFRHASV